MAIKATCSVTLSAYRDIEKVTRYYKLQSSTAASPTKPTVNPPVIINATYAPVTYSNSTGEYTSGTDEDLDSIKSKYHASNIYKLVTSTTWNLIHYTHTFDKSEVDQALSELVSVDNEWNMLDDGSITFYGSYNSSSIPSITLCDSLVLHAGTYTLSGAPDGGTIEMGGYMSHSINNSTDTVTFTIDRDLEFKVTLYINEEYVDNTTITFKPQLNSGSTVYGYTKPTSQDVCTTSGHQVYYMWGYTGSVRYPEIGYLAQTSCTEVEDWTDTEPSYTSGSTNTLYFCDLTEYSNGTWEYSAVSKSSSYEAAKEAYNKAQNAQDVADAAQNDINNLEIGGRNLLVGTGIPITHTGSGSTNECTSLYDVSNYYINLPSLEGEQLTLSFEWETTATSGTFVILLNDTPWTSLSETITVSSSNNSGKAIHTVTADSGFDTGDYWGIKIRSDDLTGDVTIKNTMFEQGNKAADWTPAPEDMATNESLSESTKTLIATIDEHVSTLQTNEDSIIASVNSLETKIYENAEDTSVTIESLQEKVGMQLTEDAVNIQIDKKLQNGVNKVETSTGFKFDEDGLNISKTGSSTNTQITENGMEVKNTESGKTMLTANSEGVDARNLRAETYLIVGTNSRFENYEVNGEKRTACFWIGG